MMGRSAILLCAGLITAAWDVAAAGDAVRVGPLPAAALADLEVSAGAAFAVAAPKERFLTVSLSLFATATNGVSLELGAGPGADWPDPDGTAVELAWDCGEWAVAGDRGRRRFAAAASPGVEGMRTLTARVTLGRDGGPVDAEFTERMPDGTRVRVAFGASPEERAEVLPWLDCRGWGGMLVTSRGRADASGASARAGFSADGTTLILR